MNWVCNIPDLHRESEIGIIVDAQVAKTFLRTRSRGFAEILIGSEQKFTAIVIRCGVTFTVCVRRIYVTPL